MFSVEELKKYQTEAEERYTEFTIEQACALVVRYVRYHSTKLYSIADHMSMDDVVSEIATKLITKDMINKFDSSITTKKNYINRIVYTSMVDMLRYTSRRKTVSLNRVNEHGLEYVHTLVDGAISSERELIAQDFIQDLIDRLPDTHVSRINCVYEGVEDNISPRTVATLMFLGVPIEDMRTYFINPSSKQPISEGRMSQAIRDVKTRISELVLSISH